MSTTLSEKDITKIAFKTTLDLLSISSRNNSEVPIFIDDACDITGYSKATIYSLIHKKEIPSHKTAGRRKLFFYKSELLTWMNSKNKEEVVNG